MSHLLHALPRCHPLNNQNRVFPVVENVSDTNNLLLYATCVKGQLLTMSVPDSQTQTAYLSPELCSHFNCEDTNTPFTPGIYMQYMSGYLIWIRKTYTCSRCKCMHSTEKIKVNSRTSRDLVVDQITNQLCDSCVFASCPASSMLYTGVGFLLMTLCQTPFRSS